MNEPRDTLVGDALRRIDVPDHAPDFWSRLEHSLAEGSPVIDEPDTDEPDTDGEETTVVDLESSPAAKRAADRNRTPMLALAAAVAIVVALVVGVAALGGGGDDQSQVDTADDPTETPDAPETSEPDVAPPPEDEAGPDTSAPQETTTSVIPGETLAADAEELAADWIDALGEGDMATAYDLLDDQSQADLDRTQFEELSTGLAEGAAAFAADGIARNVKAVPAAAGVFHVVTFTGEVEREGMVETASYPVVVTGTGVHFTPDGPQLELDPDYLRSSGTTLTPPLEVLVSDTADTWLWIDGDDPERFLSPGRLELGAEAIGGPGTHIVSLVAIEDGRITARAYTAVVP